MVFKKRDDETSTPGQVEYTGIRRKVSRTIWEVILEEVRDG